MDTVKGADAAIAFAQLVHHQAHFDEIQTGRAMFEERAAYNGQVDHLAGYFPGEFSFLPIRVDLGQHLNFDKVPYLLAQGFLLVREMHIDLVKVKTLVHAFRVFHVHHQLLLPRNKESPLNRPSIALISMGFNLISQAIVRNWRPCRSARQVRNYVDMQAISLNSSFVLLE